MAEKTITLDGRGVKIGGKYQTLLCASLFYFRIPRAHWAQRIEAIKNAGYNCVDVYFPWNYHEREDGSFDFNGERNVGEFLELLAKAGVYVIVRPGPYICSEWTGGAIPARLLESDIPLRCADARFLQEVEKWYRAVLGQILPYEYGKNGTVILMQLDNELDFYDCPDPNAYIGALREFAKSSGATVPLFCCAGQYGIERSGGTAEGVQKTLNCYPSSTDVTFDAELRGYGLRFKQENIPLLVSETNRDHFLLRRELSCGSKLLGAYNQVAGVNFDFNQSVNNWGSPVSFLCSEYDFWSMVDIAGNYTQEVKASYLFSLTLRALGERIAGAYPSEESVVPESSTFTTTGGGLSVLELMGGGKAVCVPNFTEQEGEIAFRCNGLEISGSVGASEAPFFLFGVDLKDSGIPAVLTRANCEPILIEENRIVFCAKKSPFVGLDFGGGEQIVTKNATLSGVKVEFLTPEEGVALSPNGLKGYTYTARGSLPVHETADMPTPRHIPAKTELYFGALGIGNGKATYRVKIPAGKQLFVEHPCDIISYTIDQTVYPHQTGDGRDILLPPSISGEYSVVAQKWGSSNFDDSQAPCLRIACRKGVTSFGYVEEDCAPVRADFKLLDRYGDEQIDLTQRYPVRIGVNSWNSTRKPVICSYSYPVKRHTDRLIVKATEKADVAVYLNGKLLGECDYGTFELTPYTEKGKDYTLTLVYRKRVWTADCGSVHILSVNTVAAETEVLSKRDFGSFSAGKGKEMKLPFLLKTGETKCFCIDVSKVDKEGYLQFAGKNVLLTCVLGGRVIGRIITDWEKAPPLVGGDPTKLYLSPVWCKEGKTVSVYAEGLGEGAAVTGETYFS